MEPFNTGKHLDSMQHIALTNEKYTENAQQVMGIVVITVLINKKRLQGFNRNLTHKQWSWVQKTKTWYVRKKESSKKQTKKAEYD